MINPKCLKTRHYKPSDFKTISSWWTQRNEPGPNEGMLPSETTLIVEYKGIPAVCLSIYFTNSKEISYLENVCTNPNIKKEIRQTLLELLTKFAFGFAKDHGYKRMIVLSYKDKVKKRYEQIGFTKTIDNVSTYVRVL